MRVVAGSAGGRLLRAPAGRATRPTSDRVREAVFSMLDSLDAIDGADVLDLFAGSGALGIEALSRGARRVTFVEREAAARSAIGHNLTVIDGGAERATILGAEVLGFLASAPAAGLVFADPPYAYDRWPVLLERLRSVAGVAVLESGRPLTLGPGWETVRERSYGGTVVVIARPVPRPDGVGAKGAR